MSSNLIQLTEGIIVHVASEMFGRSFISIWGVIFPAEIFVDQKIVPLPSTQTAEPSQIESIKRSIKSHVLLWHELPIACQRIFPRIWVGGNPEIGDIDYVDVDVHLTVQLMPEFG